MTRLFPALFACVVAAAVGRTQDVAESEPTASAHLAESTEEIRQAIDDYVTAFNDRDAERMGEMWTPHAVYTDRTSSERVIGRDAIMKQFTEILADESNAPKLAVSTRSIEFVSPSVAIERGQAVVSRGEEVSESEYTAVYVKHDKLWLIDRVTEEAASTTASHYEQLKVLEWLLGEWVDAGDGFEIDTTCKWTENQNFISRIYSVTNQEGVESSGLQLIGWDAASQEIRSWLFDSSGGYVLGTWTQRDDKWVVQSVATLADGARGSFTSIFRPTDDGNYTWQKINRVIDGRLLPNIDEVTIRRK